MKQASSVHVNSLSPTAGPEFVAATVVDASARPEAYVERPDAKQGTATAEESAPPPGPPSLPTVRLGGVLLHAITEEQAIETILAELECGRGGVVVTPNLDHLHRYQKNLTFAALVDEADLVVADGMPLVWASRIRGTPLPERVAGSNLITSLSTAAAQAGRRVFLLGGDPGAAEGAARVLRERIPDLHVAGTHCPPKGFEYDSTQMAIIVDKLQESRPDIVFVALGSPKQEKLVNRIRRTLPGAWWLGVGISFSFLTGQVRRAPVWMQKTGFEWVHRLLQEPRRLFRRYVVVGIPFAIRLGTSAAIDRVGRALGLMPPEPVKRHAGTIRITDPLDEQARASGSINARAVSSVADGRAEAMDDLGGSGNDEPAPDTSATLSKIRGLILLGGKVRPSDFARSCGRPVLELPLSSNERLCDYWLRQAEGVAATAKLDWLPIRIVISDDSDAPLPEAPHCPARPAGAITVERDLSEFRGTGGLLHDLAGDYADDDMILMANAAQILIEPLAVIARALAHKGADVAVIAHEDGTPSGVMLIRVKALRGISPVGYVDMKEQALPRIALEHTVRAVRCRQPTAAAVRSREGYLAGLRQYHAKMAGQPRGSDPDPLAETFGNRFAVIEPGAIVHPEAFIHDSVILTGARVDAGAVVVRSIVSEGAHVKRGARVVDSFAGEARALAS